MKRAVLRRTRGPAAAAALAGLAACTVGPSFTRPPPPPVTAYVSDPLGTTASAATPGGNSQHFLEGMDIPGQWWTLFHSEDLSALIERGLKANPDIKAAQAALRVALENAYAQEGAFYPTVQGSFFGTRQKTSRDLSPVPASGSTIFNLFTGQISVSYMPDVFGLTRRQAESLQAQAEAQRFQLEATYLTLTANLASAAFQEASLRAQIAATEEIIRIETDLVALFRRQSELGQIAGLEVAAQDAALAQAQATLPPLQKQLAQQRDVLTVLAGDYPGTNRAPRFELASLQLPESLPVSLPSRLVDQRPDIRQAEANLHFASAEIGVAIANRLPNIMLTPSVGKTALDIASLFTPGSAFWTLAGSVTQTIFDGGTLLHKERAARAAFDQAAEQYRSTVLNAFQNVAAALHALQSDADAVKASFAAERAARTSLDLTRRQVDLGAVNYVALLTAQQTYLQTSISLVQAQTARYADTAALFQALGGGWWNRAEASSSAGDARAGYARD